MADIDPYALRIAAVAIWAVQREDLDKCDMDLDDVGDHYDTFKLAKAALASLPAAAPAQEAVAWRYVYNDAIDCPQFSRFYLRDTYGPEWTITPLYVAPQAPATGGAWVLEIDVDGQAIAFARPDLGVCPTTDEALQFARKCDAERFLTHAGDKLDGFYVAALRSTRGEG